MQLVKSINHIIFNRLSLCEGFLDPEVNCEDLFDDGHDTTHETLNMKSIDF
jgi:hypothetical protein